MMIYIYIYIYIIYGYFGTKMYPPVWHIAISNLFATLVLGGCF